MRGPYLPWAFSVACLPWLRWLTAAFLCERGESRCGERCFKNSFSWPRGLLFPLGLPAHPIPYPRDLSASLTTRLIVTTGRHPHGLLPGHGRWRGLLKVSRPGCPCPRQGSNLSPQGRSCVWHFKACNWPFLLPFGLRFSLLAF